LRERGGKKKKKKGIGRRRGREEGEKRDVAVRRFCIYFFLAPTIFEPPTPTIEKKGRKEGREKVGDPHRRESPRKLSRSGYLGVQHELDSQPRYKGKGKGGKRKGGRGRC